MATAAASIFQNFEELQRELQAFNELFSLWTEQRRRALMDDKEAYLKTLSEEQDTVEALKKQYQQLVQQKQQIHLVLEAEQKEREEYTSQNEEYAQQRDNLKHKLGIIMRETELMEKEIMKESRILEARYKSRELGKEERTKDLLLFREKLGIVVIPSDSNPNHLHITFTQIDLKDPHRQFKFIVDHTDMLNLRPFQFSPQLPADVLQTLSSRPHSDFYAMLSRVRAAFAASI